MTALESAGSSRLILAVRFTSITVRHRAIWAMRPIRSLMLFRAYEMGSTALAAESGTDGDNAVTSEGRPVHSTRAERAKKAGSLLRGTVPTQTRKAEKNAAQTATEGALIGEGLRYTKAVKGTLDRGVKKVNALGHQQRNCNPGVLTGHVAEADHTATFNADAAFQGKTVHATRLSSFKAKSADVVITDRPGGQVIREVQSKVFYEAERRGLHSVNLSRDLRQMF